jgi:prepilin-type N-terminal cleavage/methylation domain-containing protein
VNRIRSDSAFTLIELLIVVAIIAILAAIAVPNFLEAQTRAKVSRSYADMRSVATAMEAYMVDYNRYLPIHFPGAQMEVWGLQIGAGTITRDGTYGTINPRIVRYIPLTTPVAYITTMPQDVFNQDQDQERRYWRSSERSSLESSGVTTTFYDDFYYELFPSVMWVLRGVGPSNLGVTLPSFDLDDLYDATNGTLSRGNIVFAGPGESIVGD